MNKKIQGAINVQITAEFYSAYLYLAMAAYCELQSYKGMASWLRVQYQEELTHTLKLYQFLLDRGGKVELGAVDQPPSDYKSVLDVFEQAYEHEKKVTGMINDLYELARQEKDLALQEILNWYIKEQVEEEANGSENVDNLKQVQNNGNGMLLLDQKLGARKFVDETAEGQAA